MRRTNWPVVIEIDTEHHERQLDIELEGRMSDEEREARYYEDLGDEDDKTQALLAKLLD